MSDEEFSKLILDIKNKRKDANRLKMWKDLGKYIKFPQSMTIKLAKTKKSS